MTYSSLCFVSTRLVSQEMFVKHDLSNANTIISTVTSQSRIGIMDDDQWADENTFQFDISKIAMEYFDEIVQETDLIKRSTPTSLPYEHDSGSLVPKESSCSISPPSMNTNSTLQNINSTSDGLLYEVLDSADAMVEAKESLVCLIFLFVLRNQKNIIMLFYNLSLTIR